MSSLPVPSRLRRCICRYILSLVTVYIFISMQGYDKVMDAFIYGMDSCVKNKTCKNTYYLLYTSLPYIPFPYYHSFATNPTTSTMGCWCIWLPQLACPSVVQRQSWPRVSAPAQTYEWYAVVTWMSHWPLILEKWDLSLQSQGSVRYR